MYDVYDVNDGKMIEIRTAIKIIIPQQIGSFSAPTSRIFGPDLLTFSDLFVYLFVFMAPFSVVIFLTHVE